MRTFAPLHFEDLEPRRFEDLVRQLAYDLRQWRMLEATGRAGSDGGFDARGFESIEPLPLDENSDEDTEEKPIDRLQDRLWLIQCKRERVINPAKLKSHLDDIPAASTNNLYGMVFVACCDFSKKARDVFRSWCSDRGISEAHIWGKAELEDQLYQAKNDGLLFAYFGFSLRIRRRSVKTELRARLAMKRKAERILQHYQAILLRDPTDERYPYTFEGEPPARWRVVQFKEHHPRGLVILKRRYFAYMADDKIHWDYIEQTESPGVSAYENPWHEQVEGSIDHALDQKIHKFWSDQPDRNQANYYVYELIKYEDILDIDEKGDKALSKPHVYLESIASRKEGKYIENLLMYNPTEIPADDTNRVEFFPKEFPPTDDSVDEDNSR
jgi:hypothetical protein